ncbi:hypothetical protein GTP56_11310 [Duganella sp. FT134W]|uniref:Phage tail collar domain-containing protein n=1 Tax=Duganella margarita TaxID=2692170 RepID=A0A7X4KFU6_9BURK|nr:tail fiber protein [Duganella margarita]MYM72786.1 hypothetical protein [Duganella margarita]
MDAFVGTIVPVVFRYAPENWMLCNGQLLSVSQYQVLFAVLGTRYGGDGINNFRLPDLCGRTAIGAMGTAPAPAPTVALGQVVGDPPAAPVTTGSVSATISSNNLPRVTVSGTVSGASMTARSTLYATSAGPGATPAANKPSAGAMLSSTGTSGAVYYVNPTPATPPPAVVMDASSVGTVLGGSATLSASLGAGAPMTAPLAIAPSSSVLYPMQPSLALNYIICVNGLYPSRP